MAKSVVVRKDVLQGLNLTAEDHQLNPAILRNARNLVLTNGKAVKRPGFERYNEDVLRRGMMTQRRAVRSNFLQAHTDGIVTSRIRQMVYYPLAHGFLQWHTDFQPKKAESFTREFRLFTGKIVAGRRYFLIEQAADRDQPTTQWSGIRTTFAIYIKADLTLEVRMTRKDTVGPGYVEHTVAGVEVLMPDTDYHIGVSYDGTTRTLYLTINGVLDNFLVLAAFGATEFFFGEEPASSRCGIVFLNRLYVRRTHATTEWDYRTVANVAIEPVNWFADYPTDLEPAPPDAGIYEIRFWNSYKDFTDPDLHLPFTRPLTSAEVSASTDLVGYWKCADGGGGYAKDERLGRSIILAPAPPAYVEQTSYETQLGLQFGDGNLLRFRAPASVADIDPLGRELDTLYGDRGLAGAPDGLPAHTIMWRFTTPHAFQHDVAADAGAVFVENQFFFSIFKGSTNTTFVQYTNRFSGDYNATDQTLMPVRAIACYLSNLAGVPRVVFEDHSGQALSATTLTPNTTYTLTLTRDRAGALRIYFNNTVAADGAGGTVGTLTRSGTATSIVIGCGLDQEMSQINAPDVRIFGRTNAYFDGYFKLEWFRIWKRVITTVERQDFYNRLLYEKERSDPTLLVNIEISEVTGSQIPNRCAYPALFDLAHNLASHHLGPWGVNGANEEWWDSWVNAVPPYWGSHDKATAYEPIGEEGECESLADHKDLFGNRNQLTTVNHGVFYVDGNFTDGFVPQVTERVAGVREFWKHEAGTRSQQLPVAQRQLVLHPKAGTKVWTGKTLSPLGIDMWADSRLPESKARVRVAQHPGGAAVPDVFYTYKFVYRDEEFNVFSVTGPSMPAQSGSLGVVIGADNYLTAGFCNDQNPIRMHLNPRVTSIDIYRTRGSLESLAESGPWFYLKTLPNCDAVLMDLATDAVLGEALDDRFNNPGLARFADLYNGRLVLGNIGHSKDLVAFSESGLPETFDLENAFPTEDGTNSEVTGVKTSFGSCWVFKERSIWKLDDVTAAEGLTLDGLIFTTSVGCAAPGSLVEFYAPSQGRRLLFFWSSHGPYLFDGNQPIYIGQALKGDPSDNPFAYLDEIRIKDIYARDIERLGQIWIFAIPADGSKYTKILAFDYINGAWLEHSGMRFTDVARIDVSPPDDGFGNILPPGSGRYSSYIGGGYRGRYYNLLTGERDGDSVGGSELNITTLDTVASTTTVLEQTGATWTTDLTDFVAMLVHEADGSVETRWIKYNLTNTLTVEDAFTLAPEPGDFLLICPIDFLLEFPFDHLDADTVDKAISYLVTWHSGQFYYRTALDWAALDGVFTSRTVVDAGKKRKRTYLNLMGEVIKLEIRNPLPDSPFSLAAYGYEVSPVRSSVREQ